MAAAAVLMMGMRRMAVDGLDGGDVAGHDQLRVGEGWMEVRSLRRTRGLCKAKCVAPTTRYVAIGRCRRRDLPNGKRPI